MARSIRGLLALFLSAVLLAGCGGDDDDGESSEPPVPEIPSGADPAVAEANVMDYLEAAAAGDREATCALAVPEYSENAPGCIEESITREDLAACAGAPAVDGIENPNGSVPPVIGEGSPDPPYLAVNDDDGVRSFVCWTTAQDFVWIIVNPDGLVEMTSRGMDAEANAAG